MVWYRTNVRRHAVYGETEPVETLLQAERRRPRRQSAGMSAMAGSPAQRRASMVPGYMEASARQNVEIGQLSKAAAYNGARA